MALRIVVKNAKQGSESITLKSGQHFQVANGDSIKLADHADIKVVRNGKNAIIHTAKGEEYVLENFYSNEAVLSDVSGQTLSWDNALGQPMDVTSAGVTDAGAAASSEAGAGSATAQGAAGSGAATGAFAGMNGFAMAGLFGLGAVGIAAAASGGGAASAVGAAVASNFGAVVTVAAGSVIVGNGLTVTAYDNAGVSLGSATMGADGKFTITSTRVYTGAVVFVVTDNLTTPADYLDESTGTSKDLTVDLRAVAVAAGATLVVNITPFTELAAVKAGVTGIAANVSTTVIADTNAAISTFFKVADITTTSVTDATYTAALSLESGMVENAGGDMAAVQTILIDGIGISGTTANFVGAAGTTAKAAIIAVATSGTVAIVTADALALTFGSAVVAPAITGVTDAVLPATGAVVANGATNDNAPVVNISLAAAATLGDVVNVYNGTTLLGSSSALAAGATTATVLLTGLTAATTYTLTAKVQPLVGAASTASNSYAITIDTTAPVITSAATATVAENTAITTVVYTATATDATALTYTLGGADAALFNINAISGVVTFAAIPNYEAPIDLVSTAPADAAANNVYNITVTATDAAGNVVTAPKAVAITVTPVNEAPTAVGTIAAQVAVNTAVAYTSGTLIAGAFDDVDAGDTRAYSAANLPTGLSINATSGVISGTATTDRTATPVVVTMTDSGGLSATQTFNFGVVSAPKIVSIAPALLTVANGGTFITIDATFNEDVTVGATSPTLTLTINGVTGVVANYASEPTPGVLRFTVAAPVTGNGNAISVTGITAPTLLGVSSGQALDAAASIGKSTTALTIDNVAPTLATTTYSVAENVTAVATLAGIELNGAITYALSGTGADNALFAISPSGVLTLQAAKNFEAPGSAVTSNTYALTVNMTDAAGNTTNQAVTVNVTDANEAPTSTPVTTGLTAVIGQAYTLDLSTHFTDPDGTAPNKTLTYSASGLTHGLSIDSATGVISATSTTGSADGTNGSIADAVVVTVTDGGAVATADTTQSFSIAHVSAPVLTGTIDNIFSLDVTSNIVFNVTEDVTAVAGMFIYIVNGDDVSGAAANTGGATGTMGAGFHGELVNNTQKIDVSDTSQVTINHTTHTITINPTFDLDLANNYHIIVDAGAFQALSVGNGGSGQASLAISDVNAYNFSTVDPSTTATAAASVAQDGSVAHNWWAAEGFGTVAVGAVRDFVGADYALAMTDTNLQGYSTEDFHIAANNFGMNDLLYVDNKGDNALLRQSSFDAGIVQDLFGVAPTTLSFAASGTLTGQDGGQVDVTLAGSTASFADTATLKTLLGNVTYEPLIYG